METPATRLITLILLLQRKPRQKAAELAGKLGVSVRTLHRYFGMLETMGIPIYAERGPHGGFSLVRGYRLPPLVFTPEEAVAVYLGTSMVSQTWGQLYRAAAQGAMAKLDNVLPDEQRDEVAWALRSLIVTGLHRTDPTTLSPQLKGLRQAVRECRRIELNYQSATSAEKTDRSVDPYALVLRSGWWYLVGYCHLRQALRTFRVDRIQQVTPLNQTFAHPEDFDAHAYLAESFRGQPLIQAHLRFRPEAAHLAHAKLAGWEILHENPDGSVDVTLSGTDLTWLASMVLSFSTWVTVLDPPELRSMVREWAEATAALYQEDSEEKQKH